MRLIKLRGDNDAMKAVTACGGLVRGWRVGFWKHRINTSVFVWQANSFNPPHPSYSRVRGEANSPIYLHFRRQTQEAQLTKHMNAEHTHFIVQATWKGCAGRLWPVEITAPPSATENLLESTPSVFSRGGSLLPSIYADARYIDAVIVFSKGPPFAWNEVESIVGNELLATGRRAAVASADDSKLKVIVSHHHEDHSGNGGKLAARFRDQLDVYAPVETAALLSDGYTAELYRNAVWGVPSPYTILPEHQLAPAEDLCYTGWDGAECTLQVVPAPGHCSDHHVLVAPDAGVCFTVDLFITSRPLSYRVDECPLTEMESIRNLLAWYDFDTVLCSHRGVVQDGKKALGKRLAHLEEVRERVHRLRDVQGLGIDAITESVAGKEDFIYYYSSGRFSKRHLIAAFFSEAK